MITCPTCNQQTEARKDNRGQSRCVQCWAVLPIDLVDKPKPVVVETPKVQSKPKRTFKPRKRTTK